MRQKYKQLHVNTVTSLVQPAYQERDRSVSDNVTCQLCRIEEASLVRRFQVQHLRGPDTCTHHRSLCNLLLPAVPCTTSLTPPSTQQGTPVACQHGIPSKTIGLRGYRRAVRVLCDCTGHSQPRQGQGPEGLRL
jgi:hypothetical protein